MEVIATLTMLLPTRIVTNRRWGFCFMPRIVSALLRPRRRGLSTRCCGSENIAISDEEKNADSPIKKRIAATPSEHDAVAGHRYLEEVGHRHARRQAHIRLCSVARD